MSDLKWILGMGVAFSAVVLASSGCSKAVAQQAAQDPNRAVELTVYKDDFAMVSEKRPVKIEAGHSRLTIDDISKQLDPESVLFDWLGSDEHPQVVATTYNLGVANGESQLKRLNGQQVDMMWPSNAGKPGDIISGRLEAAQQGEGFALRTKDKLYINPGGTIVASSNTASTLPQLSVELENSGSTNTKVGFSYLTRGMSWSADYVAKLDSELDQVRLECWATISNSTGTAFPTAKLTLMAGSPNRAAVQATVKMLPQHTMWAAKAPAVASPVMDRDLSVSGKLDAPNMTVGEMHAYKIPSTASIGQDQMNRVSVIGTKTVPIKRDYAIRIPTLSAWGYGYDGSQTQSHVSATLSIAFVNDEASSLGMALPAGAIRVYERDQAGHEDFTGAASIADTAKNEHINLTLSNVFDVYAEYKVLKSARLDKHTIRKTVQTTLHNEKKTTTLVRLVQSYDSRWTPVVESDKSEKLDSQTVQWKLPVKAGEERKLTYTVDIRG